MNRDNFIKYNGKYFIASASLMIVSAIIYFISMNISKDYNYIDMKIDTYIPFIKYFVVFYVLYFIMPTLSLYLSSFYNKRKFFNLFISLVICIIVANITFNVYQVKMVTATITDNDIFSRMIKFIYSSEEPLNCFPSLHAVFGVGVIISLFREKKIPLVFRIFNFIAGLGIVVSTVFIKQHYLIDVVAGVVLVLVSYGLVSFVSFKISNKQVKRN